VAYKTSSQKEMDVYLQDQTTESLDCYLQVTNETPSLTAVINVDDTSFTVDSITGISAGDVITVREGTNLYQSIVLSTSVNTINVNSPSDKAFTTAATVDVGDWNLNLDGSSATITACFCPPPASKVDIYRVNVNITDGAVMDSSKFGGISALTKGILLRVKNHVNNNLNIVVNNIGFSEQGYSVEYDPKAPAGVYGLRASKNFSKENGVAIRLDGSIGDEFQLLIQDDLTDLTLVDVTICGHIVQD